MGRKVFRPASLRVISEHRDERHGACLHGRGTDRDLHDDKARSEHHRPP